MTARARTTRPRARRATKRRGFALHWPRDWKRHGATGAAIVAVCIVASAFLVDFGAVTAGARDWLMETFGAGLVIQQVGPRPRQNLRLAAEKAGLLAAKAGAA